MMGTLKGYARGVVEDANDPEARGRYRVRVFNRHPSDMPIEHLPWAEVIVHGGKGFGDLPHYEVGDLVAVMYENGNPHDPSIIGGWISRRGGTEDLPPEVTTDYENTMRRWVRIDRVGNLFELSELTREKHIRMRSGGAELRLSQFDDSITAKSKVLRVSADRTILKTPALAVESDNTTIKALATDLLDRAVGLLRLESNKTIRLYAGDSTGVASGSAVDLGQVQDGNRKARQTALISLRSETIQIGEKFTPDPLKTRLPTNQVNIGSVGRIDIKSPVTQIATDTAMLIRSGTVLDSDDGGTGVFDLHTSSEIRTRSPKIVQVGERSQRYYSPDTVIGREDGAAEMSVTTDGKVKLGPKSSPLVIVNPDSTVKVVDSTFRPGGMVSFGIGAALHAAIGEATALNFTALATFLASLAAWINTHTHTDSQGGTTTPPSVPFTVPVPPPVPVASVTLSIKG